MSVPTRPFTCPECEGEGWVPVEPDCDPWDCAWGCHNGKSYVECMTCEGYGVAWMAFCPRCGWDSRGYFAAQDQADAEYQWHIDNQHTNSVPADGEAAGPGGTGDPTSSVPETSGPPSGAAASPGLARVGAGRDIDHQ